MECRAGRGVEFKLKLKKSMNHVGWESAARVRIGVGQGLEGHTQWEFQVVSRDGTGASV